MNLLKGIILASFFVLFSLWGALDANALIIFESSQENQTCDQTVANATIVDGILWCTGPTCGQSPPVVRCAAGVARHGTKYLEWHSTCTAYTNNRCSGTRPNSGGVAIGDGNLSLSIPSSGKLYFAGFVRFDKVANRNIWQTSGTPNNWDKLLEFGGHGSTDATRWGFGVGWINSDYVANATGFTFDIWCASTVITGACSPDHFIQNQNGYNRNNPYLGQYGRWYALVLELDLASTNTGAAKLYVNGTLITSYSNIKTRNASGFVREIYLNGTWAQVAYDIPEHIRYMDHMILTTTQSDITPYMTDPEAPAILNITAESYTAGANLPEPDTFCVTSCGYSSQAIGTAQLTANCDPGNTTLLGTKCMRWIISQNQDSVPNEIQCGVIKCAIPTSEGDTYYLGFMMNFQNPNGDIWHDGPGANSGDKGLGLHSPNLDTGGFRWDLSMGCWDDYLQCQDHKFTLWIGNPGYQANPGGSCGLINDTHRPNVSPYINGVVPQLDYNRWHAIIMGITMSSGTSGRIQAWWNGAKFIDCPNLHTTDTGANNFAFIEFGGTIAQPAYDTPAHVRYFDNIIVSKNFADVSFLVADPEGGSSDTTAPNRPVGVQIGSLRRGLNGIIR